MNPGTSATAAPLLAMSPEPTATALAPVAAPQFAPMTVNAVIVTVVTVIGKSFSFSHLT